MGNRSYNSTNKITSSKLRMQKIFSRISFTPTTLLIFVITIWVNVIIITKNFNFPTIAQTVTEDTSSSRVRPQDVWRVVYQRLPYLPLENNYINKETGKVSPDNTLIARLIRYHVFVKNRPVFFRIDWKLTLADYLGVNEPIAESTYPGSDTLQTNPIEADITAIQRLNRAQRDDLVNILVSIFNPNSPELVDRLPTNRTNTNSVPPATPTNSPPPLPQPGDANLLK